MGALKPALAAVALLVAWQSAAAAQIAIPQQPDPAVWYRAAIAKRTAGKPSLHALLALKPGRFAASLRGFAWAPPAR